MANYLTVSVQSIVIHMYIKELVQDRNERRQVIIPVSTRDCNLGYFPQRDWIRVIGHRFLYKDYWVEGNR